MSDHLECPHCHISSIFVWKLGAPQDIPRDAKFVKAGFTHRCGRCYNEHGSATEAHFVVRGSIVFKTPADAFAYVDPVKEPRPKGLRVEIDEAEMVVTDNVYKIPEIAGKFGAAVANLMQGLADVAAEAGRSAKAVQACGLACHSAVIGKTVECAVESDDVHKETRMIRAAEPGAVFHFPPGMTWQALPTGAHPSQPPEPPANVPTPSLLEAMGLQTPADADPPLLNQHLFDEVIEAARLKAGGIPTERGYKEKDEAQASRGAHVAVWLFKAGAASGAGAGIVWAVRQLLKGAL